LQSVKNANLTSDTDVPQTITSIARYLKIDHHIAVDEIGPLVVQSRQTEALSEFFVTHRQVDILRQPFQRYKHGKRID
jgi:hypothetical protein